MYIHVCQDLLCSVLEVSVSLFWPLVSMRLCGFLFYSADMICVYAVGGFSLVIVDKITKLSPGQIF